VPAPRQRLADCPLETPCQCACGVRALPGGPPTSP
jgi:hypothetical protein